MKEQLRTQIGWSLANFGPGHRRKGVLDHIRKECAEVNGDPCLDEWMDLVILAFDGAWRHAMFTKEGHDAKPNLTPTQAAAVVADALQQKLDRNFVRRWPDWRTLPTDRAIEHDRD